MKTKNLLFVILPLALVVGGFVFFRSSSVPALSDSPIYEDCGYHFQYPMKWKVEAKKECSAEIMINADKDDPFDYKPQTYVELIYNPQDANTLEGIVSQKGEPTKKFKKEDFEAILYREEYGFDDDSFGNESIQYDYFAKKGDTLVKITTHNGLGFRDYEKGEEIYQSFRFLK